MSGSDLDNHDGQTLKRYKRSLFAALPVGLIELDLASSPPRIVDVNARTMEILGFGPNELVGQSIERILPVSSTRHPSLHFEATEGDALSASFETTLLHADGKLLPTRARRIAFDASRPQHVLLVVEDISAELRARSRLAAIDEERRRIAHELHDTLAQNLAAIRLNAAVWMELVEQDPQQLRKEFTMLQEELKQEIDATRRSIHALRPAELDEAGFEASLRELVDGMAARYGFEIDQQTSGLPDLVPASLELPLLRMLQEALNNVGQHASARQVHLEFGHDAPHRLTVSIRDDGVGFDRRDLADARSGGHLGMVQMAERVESYGGSLLVDSMPGTGTRLRFELPLDAA